MFNIITLIMGYALLLLAVVLGTITMSTMVFMPLMFSGMGMLAYGALREEMGK